MNIEKIEINGHYVWVDKDAEIKEGDRYYLQSVTTQNMILKASENKSSSNCYKIIAASPELNLEGVPTFVKWLARKEFPNDGTQESGYLAGGFIIGYKTAEKELPTWDDVRKAIELAQTVKDYGDYKPYTEEQIIEQLKQDKK